MGLSWLRGAVAFLEWGEGSGSGSFHFRIFRRWFRGVHEEKALGNISLSPPVFIRSVLPKPGAIKLSYMLTMGQTHPS